MIEKEFKPIAKQRFKEIFGLTLKDIEPTHQQTPDFEIFGDNNSFLVELKIKGDDPAELVSIKEELRTGTIVSRETSTGRRNTLDGIIREGVKQMASYDQSERYFHVLWLHCSGRDPDFHCNRFKATLFGTQKLFSLDVQPVITCYYFNYSSFVRYSDSLDGVILSTESSMQLCVNSISPRADTFRLSELAESFRSKEGLYDPAVKGGNENFMIVDSDIDQSNKNEVLNYLKKKYGLSHIQTIDLKRHEGFISAKPPKDDN